MEVYKTSFLEKRREKSKQPSVGLFKKTIEKLQACHVTDLVYSHYGESTKQQVWKDHVESDSQLSEEVSYNFQEDL